MDFLLWQIILYEPIRTFAYMSSTEQFYFCILYLFNGSYTVVCKFSLAYFHVFLQLLGCHGLLSLRKPGAAFLEAAVSG